MGTLIKIIKFATLKNVIPVYLICSLLHTIFRVINFTTLIPLLRVLFETANSSNIRDVEEPQFTVSIDYFTELFHYHFYKIINEYGIQTALYAICIFLVITVLLSNVFQYISAIIQAKVKAESLANLRKTFFDKIISLDLSYFTETKKGEIMTRMLSDMGHIESTLENSLKIIFKEPLLIIGLFIALFKISVELTFYTLILLPVSGSIISLIANKLKKNTYKSLEAIGSVSSIMDETFSSIKIIKAYVVEKFTKNKFDHFANEYARQSYKIEQKMTLASPVSEFLGVSFLSLLLLLGGNMVLSKTSTLDSAEFIVFLIIFSQILSPAKSVSNAFSSIQRGIASGTRIFDMMESKRNINDIPDAIEKKSFDSGIEFKNVSFAYETKEVLKNINFTIKKGETVALVGSSGGGKSTIADLIPRFYDVNNGTLLFDNEDIKKYKMQSLRKMIGMVTQEAVLFNDTIYNNILLGNLDATKEEVIEASKIANAHEFIEKLENDYHTNIGERGVKLSGGQRQRITITRAILKNPPILILDEATSALDSESEKLVQDALSKVMKNRTVLVIAHRLSTIQNADKIIVIEDGTIAEQGTHHDLINFDGIYKKLIQLQKL